MRSLFIVLALALAAGAQSLPFVEQSSQDPSLAAFRKSLQKAVAARDWKALTPLLAPDITYTFGLGKPGPKGFRAFWDRPDRNVWKELSTVLQRGGALDGPSSYWAPYYYRQWPEDKPESDWVVLAGEDVPLYPEPNLKSHQYRGPSWWLVKVARPEKYDPKWVEIYLPADYQNALKFERAFVERARVGHLLGYRAQFEKKGGRWLMTTFVAGD